VRRFVLARLAAGVVEALGEGDEVRLRGAEAHVEEGTFRGPQDLRRALDRVRRRCGGELGRGRDEVVPELSAFLTERLRFLLERDGHAADTIEAVLAADAHDPADAAERVAAVDAMRKEADFAPLAAAGSEPMR